MAVKQPDLSEFRRIKKAGCGFAQINLKPEHVDTVKAAMQAQDISGRAIYEWLQSKGYGVGKESVIKHRAGNCSCR